MVTGSAWRKSNLRQIRMSLGRYLAILAIVALGIGFFAGLKAAQPSMLRTGEGYLRETNFYDYRLISTLGLTAEDVTAFSEQAGVAAAEGGFSADFTAEADERELTLKALTLPQQVNVPKLIGGRMPERAGECLADADRFSEEDLGATLRVTKTAPADAFTVEELTVVGLCESPLYLGVDRGTTSLGGGSLNGFVLLPAESFAPDYFTEIYLTLTDTAGTELYSDAYGDAANAMSAPLQELLEARAQLRYDSIVDEARAQLADAQAEYDKGEATYRSERAAAEEELAEAKQALENGAAQLSASRTQLAEAEKTIEQSKAELEAGQKQYDDGLAAFTTAKADTEAQLAAAQATIDENRKPLDDAMAQINDSGILVQHETLENTANQLSERLAQAEEGSADYLLCKELYDAAELELRKFEETEAYQGYLQLVDGLAQIDSAQAELDQKRAEAEASFAEQQALLDESKAKLDAARQAIADGEKEIEDGWAAVASAQQQLADGQAEYDAGYAEAQERFAEAEAELNDAKKQLDDAQVEVEKLEHPSVYLLDRSTNSGYVSFRNDTSIVDQVAKVFPLFFFAVAALVCMTTMTRMIDEQRTQIGTLKALGYSDGRIAGRYMAYSGSAALLGCIFGFAVGTWLFPLVIWGGYSILYDFAPLQYVFKPLLAVVSLLAAMVCSMGVTYLTCRSELRRMPAALMRPKTPKAGKRILLERVPFLWNRFSFLYKVSIRNIVRYKKRLIMMLLGIGGCTALIITGLGLRDTISTVVDDQFEGVTHYDIAVSFSVPMNAAKQTAFREQFPEMQYCVFAHTGSFETYGGRGISNITVLATSDADITSLISLHDGDRQIAYPQSGAVIDRHLADSQGLKIGDTLSLRVSDAKTVEIPVTDICDNYVYHYAFVTAETYESLFGEDCEYATAFVQSDGDPYALGAKLSDASRVAAVTVTDALREMVGNTMKSLDAIVALVVISACALALVVLFNLCNISITERIREIATVKVLGFYTSETLTYVFREIILLTVLGALVGIPAGKALHHYVISEIRIDLVSFNIHVAPLSYALAFGITIVLGGLVCLLLARKINRVPMAESLKSVE